MARKGTGRKRIVDLSGYRLMWLIAMFDLPVETPLDRKRYTRFRKTLLKDGFMMLQFSVYARFIPSEEAAESHRNVVRAAVPPTGQVRILAITDHQFGRMEVFFGRKPRKPESPPAQFVLFQTEDPPSPSVSTGLDGSECT